MVNDCIFCKIARGEISSDRIYENDNFFSVLDINPAVEGHALVISKEHFITTLDIKGGLGNDLLDCLKETAKIVLAKNGYDGFNVINNNFESAEQVVGHVHYHVIPRKKGDGLKIFCKE